MSGIPCHWNLESPSKKPHGKNETKRQREDYVPPKPKRVYGLRRKAVEEKNRNNKKPIRCQSHMSLPCIIELYRGMTPDQKAWMYEIGLGGLEWLQISETTEDFNGFIYDAYDTDGFLRVHNWSIKMSDEIVGWLVGIRCTGEAFRIPNNDVGCQVIARSIGLHDHFTGLKKYLQWFSIEASSSGRLARWSMILSAFDITCQRPKAARSQPLEELLAQFPNGECEPISEDIPGKMGMNAVEPVECWTLNFDRSSTATGGGIGFVLTPPEGDAIQMSFKLDFEVTNNGAEYEALIVGLIAAKELGVKHILILGDSKLIVRQAAGKFALKEIKLLSYRTAVLALSRSFTTIEYKHAPRNGNRHADALATLGSKVETSKCPATLRIEVKKLPVSLANFYAEEEWEEGDWRREVRDIVMQGGSHPEWPRVKNYLLHEGLLYFRGPCGVLLKCIGEKTGRSELSKIHEDSCEIGAPSLYRRMQRQGYFWPKMREDALALQQKCTQCSLGMDISQVLSIDESHDWRLPIRQFLSEGLLPSDKTLAAQTRKRAYKYVIMEGVLYRKGYDRTLLTCLFGAETHRVMEDMHETEHQGSAKLCDQLLSKGYVGFKSFEIVSKA